ncbi:hypothetical protein TWF694_003262 [Orbilia ellipsospora]|uniref:GH64 domain-containing protein n=1 Tax=Orbilia ellipsospora TaxID=2528407 RepID=A0AAV9X2D0_9PEZI
MTPSTLDIHLTNHTTSSHVYATISGLAIDRSNSWCLIQSDGKTPYYPPSPPTILQPVPENCAIPLPPPTQSIKITIPRLAGGRIYFSLDKPLVFLLNPGPALVEPSVTNPTDPNYHTDWTFMEFTYNQDQLYANISYVDFISIPISLSLTTSSSAVKRVLGLPRDGLEKIANGLESQSRTDGEKWGDLIVRNEAGRVMRILSPNQGMILHPSLFEGYFEPYINAVWEHYSTRDINIDTQCHHGVLTGRVNPQTQLLCIDGVEFSKPCTRDIFNASSGPFQTGSDAKRNAIIPRLNAEFNRSVLLKCDGKVPVRGTGGYYTHGVTNHYARLVHGVNIDGRGYAHPYDDVSAGEEHDHSGFVSDGGPKRFEVVIGGVE